LNSTELNVTACLAKVVEIGLGKGLILALECFREGNVFQFTRGNSFGKRHGGFAVLFAHGVNDCQGDVIKGLSATRAAVIDA